MTTSAALHAIPPVGPSVQGLQNGPIFSLNTNRAPHRYQVRYASSFGIDVFSFDRMMVLTDLVEGKQNMQAAQRIIDPPLHACGPVDRLGDAGPRHLRWDPTPVRAPDRLTVESDEDRSALPSLTLIEVWRVRRLVNLVNREGWAESLEVAR
ncbi:hypothetical protein SAMN05216188_12957 [Lentzea xinjiangensis]|uniref:Uncharacterized protein n=1 Tax=Lentzea xinjiangensis TaxID=402600 RepID=A0A1H9W097_9PSEU|nr:hypothetical protein [Lentzea xinjiangensis]SES27312.1 hypothetical protein SAMN05216188_12957 [Lentzea xinjiangensis]